MGLWSLGSPKICSWQSGDPGDPMNPEALKAEVDVPVERQSSRLFFSSFFSHSAFCSIPAFSRLDEAQWHWEGQSAFIKWTCLGQHLCTLWPSQVDISNQPFYWSNHARILSSESLQATLISGLRRALMRDNSCKKLQHLSFPSFSILTSSCPLIPWKILPALYPLLMGYQLYSSNGQYQYSIPLGTPCINISLFCKQDQGESCLGWHTPIEKNVAFFLLALKLGWCGTVFASGHLLWSHGRNCNKK